MQSYTDCSQEKKMDKTEMIERALEPYVVDRGPYEGCDVRWDALAQQAIVIECEVEHIPGYDVEGRSDWVTCLRGRSPLIDGYLDIDGKHGAPGKYLFIGLPLEEEDVTQV